MKKMVKFVKNGKTIGYALAYNQPTGWGLSVLRLKLSHKQEDLKNSDAIDAETGNKLFTLDNLWLTKSDGFLFLKGRIL